MKSLIGGVAATVSNRIGGASATTYSGTNRSTPGLFGNDNGRRAQMEQMVATSTLHSIVSRIANSTSEVNWRLYRKKVDGRRVTSPNEGDRTELAVHPALMLWDKPNPFMSGQQFVETVQQHQELTGEQWWIVSRDERSPMPLEMWPVRPDRMTPVVHPTEFISGYVYTDANGSKTWYDTDEVIHIKAPHPLDLYRGLGVVQTLMVDLGAGQEAAAWNRNFFGNNAAPGGVIEFDNRLSDPEFTEFNERWRENHRGTANAHRVAMLDNGAKWKDVQLSMKDMQFTELRGLTREIVREAFGIHGHMLGLSADINRANAEAAEDVFARWLLRPRLNRIKAALNSHLLPLFGESAKGVEFDYDDPSLENGEADNARLNAATSSLKTLMDAGADWESACEATGLIGLKQGPRREQAPQRELEGAVA